MITLQFVWRVDLGNLEELRSVWRELSRHVENTEPGVLAYSLFVNEETERAHVLEIYEDAKALAFHSQNSRHITQRLAELITVERTMLSGELGETLKEAFAARYPLETYPEETAFVRLNR